MKTIFCVLFISFISLTAFSQPQQIEQGKLQDEMDWRYDQPATKYWEGLPIGTGRFAAMVLGKTDHEVIPFNDETLWSGGPYDPNNAEGPSILANIRRYALEKDYVKATTEASRLGSTPTSVQHYQPMGVLNLAFDHPAEAEITNYQRKLSMDRAVVTITYRLDGVDYQREIFASYPDQIVVMKITASKPGSINLKGWLTSLQPSAMTHVADGDIIMRGTTAEISKGTYKNHVLPAKVKWQSRLKVLADGGKVIAQKTEGPTGDQIQVQNADAVTILLAGATNWKSWNDVSADERARCDGYIEKAAKFDFSNLLKRHLEDYVPLFAACKLDLGKNNAANLNTTERLEKLRAGGDDPLFISQYFQYGRYLLLAGAREGTLAFNNHNIWLDNMEGRWQGRWTLNINLQECYWPVETTNLGKVNESLLLFTQNLAEAGRRTAKELYGARGWAAHLGTDIWFNTAPTDGNPQHATFPTAGAWLMQQLYDHYTYDPKLDYLKEIYPLLKGAAEFCLDLMVTDPATGWLVTCPSTSPENTFLTSDGERASVSMGSSIDNQLIRRLFRNCIEAAEVLETDAGFQSELKSALAKLPPHQIGQQGQLQEWLYDFKETEVGHRHLSHLFACYPDDDITLRNTPDLAKAVGVVLDRRGDINRGWSGAWKINMHARLEDPEPAYKILKAMLTDISLHPRPEDSRITPSFEGNQGIQGVTAGIAELLMQSHSGEVSLLPALPRAWAKGSVSGLRARGGYTVAIGWENNALKRADLHAKYDGTCRLRTKTAVKISENGKEIPTEKADADLYVFQVSPGKTYTINAHP